MATTITTSTTAGSRQPLELNAAAMAQGRYVCFGGFQLDVQRELLLKDGGKVRLPGKVFQTLVALLERPGEVVSREALREKLWPEGTFVNYDANVNTTMNKLRLALGDSPEQPAYIETIPRLGYCFVGKVERRNELPKTAAAATPAAAVPAASPNVAAPKQASEAAVELAVTAAPAAPAAWTGWRSRGWAAVVLLCGVLIGMGIVLLARHY